MHIYGSKAQLVAKLREHYEFSPKVTIKGKEWPCIGDSKDPYYGYVTGHIAGIPTDNEELLKELVDAIHEAFNRHCFPVAEVIIRTLGDFVSFDIRSTLAPPLPTSRRNS